MNPCKRCAFRSSLCANGYCLRVFEREDAKKQKEGKR